MTKIALVTGASRGIGRAIAIALAETGIVVAVHYNNSSDLALDTVNTIVGKGGTAFTIQGDVSKLTGIDKLYQELDSQLTERFGENKFDILVNNAGALAFATIEETNEETFDEIVAVNLKAPFFIIKKALSRLRDGGRIINISSGVTRVAFPTYAIYAPTKGALNTLTMLLAKQLGERGITVNAIEPGLTQTDMVKQLKISEELTNSVVSVTALGRIGQPQDIADVAAFIASDKSRWITGQIIDAGGGFHL
ncbi:MAG: SDR family oxidoreductase [Scytonematopsis contorta HA4267-MV1]|jgi:NAD(P)-dependent dehydrogenase (short-subunit alcohol dehydrogenase family)|nr:SDR family oxidoreductase [Scytonematopsis contorta HA4267-MV1]